MDKDMALPTDPAEIKAEIDDLLSRIPVDTTRGRFQHLINALVSADDEGGGTPAPTPKTAGYIGSFTIAAASVPFPHGVPDAVLEMGTMDPYVGDTMHFGAKSIDGLMSYISTFAVPFDGTAILHIVPTDTPEPDVTTIGHHTVTQNWVDNASKSCSFEVTRSITGVSYTVGQVVDVYLFVGLSDPIA